MRQTNKQQLQLIAQGVRQWAEHTKPEHWSANLAKMCARASGELFKRLAEAGFEPELVIRHDHMFVRCCGYAIDVTATQFYCDDHDYKPVEVVSLHKAKKITLWKPVYDEYVTRSLEDGIAHQKKRGWPNDQLIMQ